MEEKFVFRVRTYGWQELALLYNPGITPNAANRRLRKWITKNRLLYEELQQAGWEHRSYLLTPRQVEIIVKYLGEP